MESWQAFIRCPAIIYGYLRTIYKQFKDLHGLPPRQHFNCKCPTSVDILGSSSGFSEAPGPLRTQLQRAYVGLARAVNLGGLHGQFLGEHLQSLQHNIWMFVKLCHVFGFCNQSSLESPDLRDEPLLAIKYLAEVFEASTQCNLNAYNVSTNMFLTEARRKDIYADWQTKQ